MRSIFIIMPKMDYYYVQAALLFTLDGLSHFIFSTIL